MDMSAARSGKNADRFDWDEVRFVLAIARAGTMSAAGGVLEVDQTTVSRRLKTLERRLGTQLFERDRGRMRPTGPGVRVIEHGERIEREMAALCHVVDDADTRVRGVTRITAVDTLITHYLARLVAPARAAFPTLSIELVAGNHNLDLARREADIALRLARPASGDLVIRRLGELGLGVYGAAGRSPSAWPFEAGCDWLAYDRDMMGLPEMVWLAERIDPARIVFRSNGIDALARAAADGLGLTVLPHIAAQAHDGLVRLPVAVPSRDVWMVVARGQRELPRVRSLADWLAARFAADAVWLRGGAAG
ncbi:LysR family transcriptional regulator [Nitrogeniibacter mangrovi]|uniref:LysR family transcriptional regulator n=1 Tax=Nitrogeniibacter mangrovi TaxID=2016596 RepID=A0A6C1B1Q7_9RHOO|nr:LysR family transcriptional regulator [Nitrogeniibacter mangrovi]QID16280.1 LysR family transcriptional regulator [Nitrogeniibacter mangrovi]